MATGRATPGYRDPVRSDVPALVLAGALDPISPPEWAEAASRFLTHSTLILRPGAGHLDWDDCTHQLIAEFITRTDTKGMDTSCAARSRRAEFWVK